MKINNYCTFVSVFLLCQTFCFSQNIFDSEAAIFYKKKWDKKDLPFCADTTKTIISFNDYYNINNMVFNTKKVGYCNKEKLNYSYDSVKYCLVNKEQLLIHVVVFDSTKNIKEEGNLKGIGPFAINQRKITNDSSFHFNYSLYYYLVKFDKWYFYDVKQNKLIEKLIELPELINFDQILDENVNAVKKRRNKFLKKNNLKNDYYE